MPAVGRTLALLGLGAALGVAGQFPLRANVPGERTIAFHNIHTKETLSIVYKRRGQYQADALTRINWLLRDWRQNAPTRIDPKLIDLAWEIHSELGSKEPIHVISGYRSPKTNAMLRKTRGGQARRSQHMYGRAMDIRFPDVPVRRLRYSALIRERGGVGYYPTSATPFVHIDTGRVRHWPRMGRYELALLFPNGRSRHRPRSGGPITSKDVRIARSQAPQTAQKVAAFHQARRSGAPQTRVASIAPGLPIGPFNTSVTRIQPPAPRLAARPPQLRTLPRVVDRSSRFSSDRNALDRAALTRLAAFATGAPFGRRAARTPRLAPSLQNGLRTPPAQPPATAPAAPSAWVRAPQFDEEHPEELSYRPFPVLPFLTTTASPHDPALAVLVHPDSARTLELLDDEGAVLPLRLRPGEQMAQMLWAQAFSGRAVELNALHRRPQPSRFARRQSPLPKRTVQTVR